ncbi:MAG: MlaE family ABC transporter permease [Sphingomonadaceae bacterium]
MASEASFYLEDTGDGGVRLVLSGPYLVSTIGAVDQDLRAIEQRIDQIDMSGISEIDTVGAWMICAIERDNGGQFVGGNERANRLIAALHGFTSSESIEPKRLPLWERVPAIVGTRVVETARGMVDIVSFLGHTIAASGSVLLHPSRFPGKALVRQMEMVGVSSLGIVGLMSFLIGVVIAQQGAVQLAQFGAEALTVNLVGRITLRELGVLMTAIMVAGRSGSAFAAQIGTMKLTEEVDAMRTIGISPMEALVVPRIFASVLMMPLLGFYSSVIAIVGGAVIADVMLGMPFFTFLARVKEVVPLHDVWVGLIKAPVFGLIVALSGCYQGMQVKGNSEEVGLRTTIAVVQAIFAVIVLDAFFAVFFTEVDWG